GTGPLAESQVTQAVSAFKPQPPPRVASVQALPRVVNLRSFGEDLPDLEVEEDNAASIANAIRGGAPFTVTADMKAQYPVSLAGFQVGQPIFLNQFKALTASEDRRRAQEIDERRRVADQEQWQAEFGLKKSAQECDQLLRTRQQGWTQQYQSLQAELAERGANLAEPREALNPAMEQKRFELDTLRQAGQLTLEQAKLELDQAALRWAKERFGIDLAFRQEQAALDQARWEKDFALKVDDQAFRQALAQ